jgi:hypothetical protein
MKSRSLPQKDFLKAIVTAKQKETFGDNIHPQE